MRKFRLLQFFQKSTKILIMIRKSLRLGQRLNIFVDDMKKALAVVILLVFVVFPFGSVVKANPPLSVINNFPYAITAIFAENDTILVGTQNGLYVSVDGGRTFSTWNTGLSDFNITGITKIYNNFFVGTREGGLYYGSLDSKIWKSLSDKVDCPTVTSISSEGNTIYVTSICSGFHVSFDGGKTWFARNGGLPTLKTTSFLKTPSGRCFLGTDGYGLFYSDNLGESCTWIKIFKDYTVTSISYLGSSVFVGTNSGLFASSISKVNFEKLDFVGGSPYIANLVNISGILFVSVRSVGLFVSLDGVKFYQIFEDDLNSPNIILFDGLTKFVYIGDSSGRLYRFDIVKPFLLVPTVLNLGDIRKGESAQFKITFLNAGLSKLSGSIIAPYFIKPSSQNFTDNATVVFNVDTSSLAVDKYTVPLKFVYNGDTALSYVSFNLIPQTSITIKITIGSNFAYVNDNKFTLDALPFIDPKTNRALVPVRFITEAFGADVRWDPLHKVVTITLNDKVVRLQIGNNQAVVDGQFVTLNQPPVIVNGRTFVPIRFISETFGAYVRWDQATKTITIVYKLK